MKGISTALIYHLRWELRLRVSYHNTNNNHTHTHTHTHTHRDGGINTAVKKTNNLKRTGRTKKIVHQ